MTHLTHMALLALLLLVAFPNLGCQQKPDRPPIILISIDTLRPDHLGIYGAQRPVSPRIDRFAQDAVVFDLAIAGAPSTLPSHASILTGLFPQRHLASFAKRQPLPEAATTLTELLKDSGYATASFNDGGQLAATWGLDQGFEVYDSVNRNLFGPVAEAALKWLDDPAVARGGKPPFLFLHTYQVHHPYTPEAEDLKEIGVEPFDGPFADGVGYRELRRLNAALKRRQETGLSPADYEYLVGAYDGEVLAMDRAFGEFLDELRRRGLYERSLIVLTSDHGEEFGEHGQWGWHSHTLFDELLRVPLLIKMPAKPSQDGANASRRPTQSPTGGSFEGAGSRVTAQVRGVDLVPTILDLLDLKAPVPLDGRSLRKLHRRPQSKGWTAISQLDTSVDGPVSVREKRWKLIDQSLFDLAADPQELANRALETPEVLLRLQRIQEAVEGMWKVPLEEDPSSVEISPEEKERLKSLGYL